MAITLFLLSASVTSQNPSRSPPNSSPLHQYVLLYRDKTQKNYFNGTTLKVLIPKLSCSYFWSFYLIYFCCSYFWSFYLTYFCCSYFWSLYIYFFFLVYVVLPGLTPLRTHKQRLYPSERKHED